MFWKKAVRKILLKIFNWIYLVFSADRREYTELKRKLKLNFNILNNKYEAFKLNKEFSDKSILFYFSQLLLGILFLVLTLIWITHIILYFLIPSTNKTNSSSNPTFEFLNKLLLFFTKNNLSFLGTGIYAVLCVYLLLTVVKGCLKFGSRFILCMEIHPLVKDETYMASIVFNVILLLLCSVSITNFCVSAFKQFTAMTDVNVIFSTQIQYVKFLKFFFQNNVFVYLLVSIFLITVVYLSIRPSDQVAQQKESEDNKQKLIDDETVIGSIN